MELTSPNLPQIHTHTELHTLSYTHCDSYQLLGVTSCSQTCSSFSHLRSLVKNAACFFCCWHFKSLQDGACLCFSLHVQISCLCFLSLSGPRWASWNLGVFICIRCAGIHRNLGVHISRVKSVNLDQWTSEQIQVLSSCLCTLAQLQEKSV